MGRKEKKKKKKGEKNGKSEARVGRRKKQCGQEIGGRLGQLGLLRVFVFNISIHVGRDTMAVCSVIRSVSHTELFLFRGVVHGGVPDRLGERESSEWYHARAVELRSPPRDPSFKRYSKWRGEERGARERPSTFAFLAVRR